MEMSGEYRIPAPREKVWAALNDPAILKACIPGCESLDMASPTEMTAKVVAKIGPVKATFTGKVHLNDIVPPESYTISGEGQGGVAGFAKGGAEVKLTPDGAGTLLVYHAKAQIGGKLAQLGARLIDSTAKMMADQFFAKFAELAGGGAEDEADTAPAAAAVSAAPASAGTAPAGTAAPAPASAPAATPAAAPRTSAPPASAATPPAKSGGIPSWIWIVAALALALIVWKLKA